MGNHQTHGLQPQVVTSLKKETGFTNGEISDLYRQFRMDNKDLYMTVNQINDMYKGVFPHGNPEQFGERVFATFDKRSKGKVDFHEFLSILSIQLKGNVKSKYEWVFDVIDFKKTGNARRDDVLHVITVSSSFLPISFRIADCLLAQYNHNR
ncbi:hypothetical protein CAPTEDRAFT_99384 [Capitella teleta]|uniref:EF-hand domain-containing protein n=1 Tax=Capitella teleta TaxID=283909 RepID=R7U4J5_CAPTE|nr:hypothetical protein CAPTEDRAFT_99384 [Capitella teleta]|eukprot:ELU01285.1 hypothetical protein CAPTEDRAFT_99384 [Capitella teleta]